MQQYGNNIKLLCLLIITIFSGTLFSEDTEKYDAQWNKYGAYFLQNDQNFSYGYKGGSFFAECISDYKIRIINEAGQQYATIPLYRWSKYIREFSVSVTNRNGNTLPLNLDKIQKKYEESGKIVVPKAESGSLIKVHIKFGMQHFYITTWASLHSSIPSVQSNFTFSHPKDHEYVVQVLGDTTAIKNSADTEGQRTNRTYSVSNYVPLPSLGYAPFSTELRPNLIFINKKTNRSNWSNEKVLEKMYNEEKNFHKLLNSSSSIKKELTSMVDDAKAKSSDNLQIAQHLLKSMQNIFTSTNRRDVSSGVIARKKTASKKQLAYLYTKMLKTCNIPYTLIHIGDQDTWPIDTAKLTNTSYFVPFPVVLYNNKEYVACCYLNGYELGQYHSDYWNAHALVPVQYKSNPYRMSPAPLYPNDIHETSFTVPYGLGEREFTVEKVFKNYSSNYNRQRYIGKKSGKVEERLTSILSSYDINYQIHDYTFKDLYTYDKPLSYTVRCEKNFDIIEKGNIKIVPLEGFFKPIFSDITVDRTIPIVSDYEEIFIDKVTITEIPFDSIKLSLQLKDMSNDFFNVSYRVNQENNQWTLTRTLKVNKCRIPVEKIPQIAQDCITLNDIEKALLILE